MGQVLSTQKQFESNKTVAILPKIYFQEDRCTFYQQRGSFEIFIHHLIQKRREVVKVRLTKRQKLKVLAAIILNDILQIQEKLKHQTMKRKGK